VPDVSRWITQGRFTEEVLEGRHFELMHPPRVNVLAARLAGAMAAEETRLLQLR
jgi:thioesterase domain-containing protein